MLGRLTAIFNRRSSAHLDPFPFFTLTASLFGIKNPDIEGLLQRVGLEDRARDRVSNYSKGMQPRLMVARDSKTLFMLSKTLNIFLVAPVIFYLFPDWPRWIAKIFPTYWLINPIFEVAIKNASLMDVGLDLGVAIVFCGLFIIPVRVMKKRVQAGLYIG